MRQLVVVRTRTVVVGIVAAGSAEFVVLAVEGPVCCAVSAGLLLGCLVPSVEAYLTALAVAVIAAVAFDLRAPGFPGLVAFPAVIRKLHMRLAVALIVHSGMTIAVVLPVVPRFLGLFVALVPGLHCTQNFLLLVLWDKPDFLILAPFSQR